METAPAGSLLTARTRGPRFTRLPNVSPGMAGGFLQRSPPVCFVVVAALVRSAFATRMLFIPGPGTIAVDALDAGGTGSDRFNDSLERGLGGFCETAVARSSSSGRFNHHRILTVLLSDGIKITGPIFRAPLEPLGIARDAQGCPDHSSK